MKGKSLLISLILIIAMTLFTVACDTSGGCETDGTTTPTPDPTQPPASYDVVVASDGSGEYRSVQAAINAAPSYRSSWYTIYVKNGTYREVVTVPSDKTYIELIGQSAGGTVITFDNYASRVGGTSGSATAFFKANDFIARNITFENSFDYPNSSAANKQAVAAEPMADRQVFVNCRITGYQDTLYVRNGRSYFKDCYIAGHTDFIFGEGTAVFDNCDIYSRPKNGGCISAPSTPAATTYGLIFLNCNVTGPSTGVWLGRPWHPSSAANYIKSNAVYINCYLGSHIATNGWTSMSGVYPATERLWEYNNSGPGAQVNSSRTQLTASQAARYTVDNILSGSDNWDPEALAGSGSSETDTDGDVTDNTTNSTVNGTYSILAVHSGKALDVWEWGTTDGTNIAQYNYWGGEAQQFNITPVDGIWHRITPVIASDQCVEVVDGLTTSGANIQTWTCNGYSCQEFRFQAAGSGRYRIINRNSGLCVTVPDSSTADGANVTQSTCLSGAENQMFELEKVSGSSSSTAITGASCTSTGTVRVTQTIVVSSGTYDGQCKTYVPVGMGSGDQSEDQDPVFRVENGATLKNVIIGTPGVDGIHLYNGATLDNITWTDVGEDACTVKSSGNYTIRNIEGYDGSDKFFQINAASTVNVSNAIIHNMGKALRQNGGTTFKINVAFDRCEIQDMDDGVFRSDSSSSTAKITNSRLRNAGDICIGNWASCTHSGITYY